MNDEDKSFELSQLARAQAAQEQLDKAVAAYEVLVPHVGDSDIMEQLEALGMPTSLPTVLRIASLLNNGVLVQVSALDLLALMPQAPFLEKEQVRERIWEQLGWAGR